MHAISPAHGNSRLVALQLTNDVNARSRLPQRRTLDVQFLHTTLTHQRATCPHRGRRGIGIPRLGGHQQARASTRTAAEGLGSADAVSDSGKVLAVVPAGGSGHQRAVSASH